jgi:4-amino-4-deoxy-L-arabinose transferase-like glycosyltransferase
MFFSKIDKNYWLIGLLAALFYLPFLGGVHLFDWDEINFAECAREMIVTNDYLRPQINFQPFWEKPPLFIWFQSLSMHIFGINEYAARFPNAICGIITLIVLYHIGKKIYDTRFGLFWAFAYMGSILPHLYFKSGIIDPFFNLFIFLSLYFWIKKDILNDEKGPLNIILAGIFSGLAILTKGPAGFLIFTLTVLCKALIYKELNWILIKRYILVGIIALLTALTWFGIETMKNGPWFVTTFIEYTIRLARTEDAGHGGFVGYHFVVLLFGCFPASLFAIRSLYHRYNFFNENVNFTRLMKVLFWVVLILFSLVQSKIVHYSSMCYFPLTFLAAITLKKMYDEGIFYPLLKNSILIMGVIIGLIFTILPFIGQNIEILKPFFKNDIFILRNLEAAATWTGFESIAGIFLIILSIILPFLVKKHGILRGILILFVGIAFFIQFVLISTINNIEHYSQRAAIEFYESKVREDCYIETHFYKSYAHLFYAQKPKPTNINHSSKDWLLRGDVDKPTYFVCKIQDKNSLDTVATLQYIYDKNGFVFYKRK